MRLQHRRHRHLPPLHAARGWGRHIGSTRGIRCAALARAWLALPAGKLFVVFLLCVLLSRPELFVIIALYPFRVLPIVFARCSERLSMQLAVEFDYLTGGFFDASGADSTSGVPGSTGPIQPSGGLGPMGASLATGALFLMWGMQPSRTAPVE